MPPQTPEATCRGSSHKERLATALAAIAAVLGAVLALLENPTAARVPAMSMVMVLGGTLAAAAWLDRGRVRWLAGLAGALVAAGSGVSGVMAWVAAADATGPVVPAATWFAGTLAALGLGQAVAIARQGRTWAIVGTVALAVGCVGIALSEAAGLPPIPGHQVAWSTAWTIAALSVAIAVAAGLPVRLVSFITGFEAGAEIGREPGRLRRVLGAMAAALLALTATGYGYLRFHLLQEEARLNRELSAVAEAIVNQVAAWRRERIGDAEVLTRSPALIQALRRAGAGAPGGGAAEWEEFFATYLRAYGYSAVTMFGSRLEEIGHWPADAESGAAPVEVAGSARAFFVEGRWQPDGPYFLDVWAPLRDEAGVFLGAVRLRADLRRRLALPGAQWPLPTMPGAVLLLRSGGGQVEPISETRAGSAAPAGGAAGPVELWFETQAGRSGEMTLTRGRDRHGAEVLGVARRVDGTSWVVAVKVEQRVAFAGARMEFLTVTCGVSLLALLLALGVRHTWRERVVEGRSRAMAAERSKQAALERHAAVLRELNDVVLVLDETLRIREANDRVQTVYGWTEAELLDRPLDDLRAPPAGERTAVDYAGILRGAAVFETEHGRKDGSRFPVEVSARTVQLDGRTAVVAIVRDVTVRKAHEREIERLGRLYRLLSRVNHLISHRSTPEALCDGVCAALVEHGEFAVAWIALRDDAGRLATMALSGPAAGFLGHVAAGEVAESQLPAPLQGAVAGKLVVCADYLGDPAAAGWRERAGRWGVRSSLALPLRRDGHPAGVVAVLHGEAGHFGFDEIGLLTEAASDVSFALEVAAMERQREHAVAASRASEARLHAVLTASPAVIYSMNPREGYRTTYISANVGAMLGFTAAEFLARRETWIDNLHPDDVADAMRALEPLTQRGSVLREYRFRHRDGTWRWMRDECRLVRGEAGEPLEVVGSWLDITEQRTAEQVRREAEAHYRTLFENTGLGVVQQDAAGRIVALNPTAAGLLGVAPEAAVGRACFDADWRTIREDGSSLPEAEHPAMVALREQRRVSNVVVGIVRTGAPVRWILADAVPEQHAPGEAPRGVFTLFTDITARLREDLERRKLSRAVEQNPASIVITDLEGRIEYVNPRFTEVTGYTIDDVRGKLPRIFKSGVMPARVYEELWATIAAGQVWRGELVNRKKSGQLHTELVVVTPVTGENGALTHYVAIKEDITERKRTETALRETQEHYRIVAENTDDVIWLYETGADAFTFVSPSVVRLIGRPADDVVGRGLETLLPPESAAELARVMRGRSGGAMDGARTAILEVEHRHVDGTRIPTEVAVTALDAGAAGGGRILGVTRNLTERRRAADALQRSLARLRQAEQIASLGSWEIDLPTRRVELSDEARRIFEIGADEPDPHGVYLARLHPGDRERIERLWAAQNAERPRVAATHRLVFPGGRIKHVDLATELVCGADGQPQRILGTVQDVTERKLVELELHDGVKLLRALHRVSLAIEDSGADVTELLENVVRHLPGAMRVPPLAASEIAIGEKRATAGAAGEPVLRLSLPIFINGWTAGYVAQSYVAGTDDAAPEQWSVEERELIESVARTLGLALGERESYEQMRRSEERFRAIFDHAEVGMFEADLAGVITRANSFLGDLLGAPPAEWVGRPWGEFVVGGRGRAALPDDPVELRCVRQGQGEFWGLLAARVERDGEGRPRGHICLLQDISNLVAARETTLRFTAELEAQVAQRTAELAARNREVQALLHANPDFILRLRGDGSVLHVHAARLPDRLAGVTIDPADPRGTAAGAAIVERGLEVGRRALASGTTEVAEASIELAAGACAVELRAAPVSGEDFVVFVRDITDRKRSEAETAAMLAKEREISDMKTRFISVASHEFRTPMAAAQASAELLANHLDRLVPEKRGELLARIRTSLGRVTEMLEDVLTLSRMDSKRTEVRIAPVELRSFLESIIDEVRIGDAAAHDIRLEAEPGRAVFPTDATLLRSIVSNLIANAVRYSPPRSTIAVRLAPDTAEGVSIAVADQGIGIPAADLGRIFEPFERGSNVGTIKGTGLGLNIVRRMTQLLGGTIDVQSAPPSGTVFTLKLPATK